jgi:hypothetical protein
MAHAVHMACSQANKHIYIYIERSINLGRIYLEDIEIFYIIHLIYKFISISLMFIIKALIVNVTNFICLAQESILIEEEAYSLFPKCCPLRRPHRLKVVNNPCSVISTKCQHEIIE